MKRCFLSMIFISGLFICHNVCATTRYVPSQYGSIQAAIDDSIDGDVIIVDDGIYTGLGNQNINFGGLAITVKSENGAETCIIDCQNLTRGFIFDNDEDPNSTLDGFTIANAYAASGEAMEDVIAGILCQQASPIISNCIIRDCSGNGGCAMGNFNYSSPTVINCVFISNSGPGMLNYNYANPNLINCIFNGNGFCGVYNYQYSSPVLINSVFSGNTGFGVLNENSSPSLTNCTFSQNSGTYYGGGVFNNDENCNPILSNCVLWDNGNTCDGCFESEEDAQISGGAPTINYCCIQGWTGNLGGIGNISDDPLFSNSNGTDDIVGTVDDDLHLMFGSHCIDAGDNNAMPSDFADLDGDFDVYEAIPLDLDYNPRFTDEPNVPNTGNGVPPIIDMGAYEGAKLGFLLDREFLVVPEGGIATFTVALSNDPNGVVEVSVAHESGDSDITVASGSLLIFDSSNYSIPQTVTLAAAEDADYMPSESIISVSVTGFDPVQVIAVEWENEYGFLIESDLVTIPEGGTGTFTVALPQNPCGTVEATVSHVSGDPDIIVESGESLTFDSSNYSIPQIVTLAAAEDADNLNESAVFWIYSSGFITSVVDVNEVDNDVLPSFLINGESVIVPEGGTGIFTVALPQDPCCIIEVNVARQSGDPGITVVSGSSLNFNSSNYSIPQTVTLADSEDSDNVSTAALIHVSGPGIATAYVSASEQDNEPQPFPRENLVAGSIPGGPTGNDFVAIACGQYQRVALRKDGSLVGWGGYYPVPSGNDFVAISCGYYEEVGGSGENGCALKEDGSIVAWGRGSWGELNVPSGNDFVAVSAGRRFFIALRSDGSLIGWGANFEGETDVPPGNDFIDIAAGGVHGVALRADGSIVAWGYNNEMLNVPTGNDFVAIAAGHSQGLALRANGSIVAWGHTLGQPPVGNDYVAIDCGVLDDSALKADGSIVAWGGLCYGEEPPPGNNYLAISQSACVILAIANVPLGNCQGILYDLITGQPIVGATVSIAGKPSVQTDQFGRYSFSDIPAGIVEITVSKTGYYSGTQTVVVGQNSVGFTPITMIPEGTGTSPAVVRIEGKYFNSGKHAYYISGPSVIETIKATIDWKGHTPSQVKWILPNGTIYTDSVTGNVCSHTFDMGSIGLGKMTVVAVASDSSQAAPKQANFNVITTPLGIPSAAFVADVSSSSLSYNAEWILDAINEGIDQGIISSDIPGFGGRAFEFIVKPLLKARISSNGTAEAEILKGYKLPSFEVASVELDPQAAIILGWQFKSTQNKWVPSGYFEVLIEGSYRALPSYYVIMVGPVPIPIYWRAALETALGVNLTLNGWQYNNSPIWNGTIPFVVYAEIMLGVGVADILAVEGYLGGGASMLLEFPSEDPLQQLDIELNGGIRLVALVFTYKNNFLHYEWHLTEGKSISSTMIPMFQGTFDASEFTLMERNYLNSNYAVWVPKVPQVGQNSLMMFEIQTMEAGIGVELDEEQLLQSNVFSQSQPTISADVNDLLLAWIYDDPIRTSVNRTEVVFSKFENDVWSPPVAIDDDGTADFWPQLVSLPTGDAFCIWENVKQELSNDANLTEMAASMEIEVGYYDNDLAAWATQSITDNNHLDRSPRIAAADNNTAMAVWIYNEKDDILGSDSNALNEIRYIKWDGTCWSEPNTVATDIGLAIKTSLAYNGNKAVYVYTLDIDHNWETENDRELYAITYDGINWSEPNRITDNNLLDTSPQLTYDGNDILTIWYQDSNLVDCYNFDINNTHGILFTSGSSGVMDFRLAKSSVGQLSLVWTETSEQGVDIFTATYDSQLDIWSKEYQLTYDLDMEKSITAVYVGSGELALAYNKVEIIDNYGIPEPNHVDLYVLRHSVKGDLAIAASDISFDVNNLLHGISIVINATIHNLGDVSAIDVPVAFYNGNPDSGGVLINDILMLPGPISAGDVGLATISWFIPDANEPQDIYIVIDPGFMLEDSNRNNNITSVSVMSPDLTIESINSERIGPKKRGITIRVINNGSLTAKDVNVSIYKDSIDSPGITNINISNLNANSSYDIWYIWDITNISFDSVEIPLYVVVDRTNNISESDEDNNLSSVLVQVGKVADVTDNGRIDFIDFAKFANNWLDSCAGPEWCEACDFNQSQQVDFNDLINLCENWLWEANWFID